MKWEIYLGWSYLKTDSLHSLYHSKMRLRTFSLISSYYQRIFTWLPYSKSLFKQQSPCSASLEFNIGVPCNNIGLVHQQESTWLKQPKFHKDFQDKQMKILLRSRPFSTYYFRPDIGQRATYRILSHIYFRISLKFPLSNFLITRKHFWNSIDCIADSKTKSRKCYLINSKFWVSKTLSASKIK